MPEIRHIDGMVSKRQILSGVLVAFLGGTVWLAIPPDEPVYQGKSLTAWLQQCVDNPMLEYGNENPPPNYRSDPVMRHRQSLRELSASRADQAATLCDSRRETGVWPPLANR